MHLKTLKYIIASFLCLALLPNGALANSKNERINWFYKTESNNTRPDILGGTLSCDELNGVLYIGPENDKTVYLTFDAGYSNENVEKTLDVLKKHNIRAAFFILPGIIKNSKPVVQRMIDEGHLICNHTTSHGDMSKITDIQQFKDELNGIETLFEETFSCKMEKYFRPPEGAFSQTTLEFCEELGYTPVFWSFAYADWDNGKQPDPEKAKNRILSQLHDGTVMLLHPTSKTNADILDSVITEITAKGYCFGTLDDLSAKLNESN